MATRKLSRRAKSGKKEQGRGGKASKPGRKPARATKPKTKRRAPRKAPAATRPDPERAAERELQRLSEETDELLRPFRSKPAKRGAPEPRPQARRRPR